jgi:DnaK suppressor protein
VDEARARELLGAERARIERALGELRRGSIGEPPDQEDDPTDKGTDLYQDAFDEGLADDLGRQLEAVERAEARLAANTYGISVESGEPIPDERLEAIPTAERTAEEEARRK